MKLILGLGSNLDNPIENLKKAVFHLNKYFKIKKVSNCYRSKSLLKDGQPDYYNAAVLIDTDKNISEIFKIIKEIENKMGKKKEFYWGPRVIDIDIIDFNNQIMESQDLKIPHKQMHKRSFVLYPLNELLDNYVHPVYNKNVNEMIQLLEDDFEIKKTGDVLWP